MYNEIEMWLDVFLFFAVESRLSFVRRLWEKRFQSGSVRWQTFLPLKVPRIDYLIVNKAKQKQHAVAFGNAKFFKRGAVDRLYVDGVDGISKPHCIHISLSAVIIRLECVQLRTKLYGAQASCSH